MKGWLMLAGALVLTVAGWPSFQAATAEWKASRASQAADTRQKAADYVKMREELGMVNPFPPKEVLAEHDAEARKLKQGAGGGTVFEGAASALTPKYLQAEITRPGRHPCQDTARSLGRSRDNIVTVNGQATHRKEAWKLCRDGVNHIKVTRS